MGPVGGVVKASSTGWTKPKAKSMGVMIGTAERTGTAAVAITGGIGPEKTKETAEIAETRREVKV